MVDSALPPPEAPLGPVRRSPSWSALLAGTVVCLALVGFGCHLDWSGLDPRAAVTVPGTGGSLGDGGPATGTTGTTDAGGATSGTDAGLGATGGDTVVGTGTARRR